MTLAARDITAINRLAAKGFRVVVEGQGVRHVVEPLDDKPAGGVASGGEARSAWDEWAAKKGAS